MAGVDRNQMLVLTRDECLHLLEQVNVGRVAVTIGALPVILPVNFRLIGERVVFRTSPGTKLDAATAGAVVAFEVDQFDAVAHAGWSVLVTGIAAEVTDPDDRARLEEVGIPRWVHGEGDRLVQVPVAMVSGRVLVPGLAWDRTPGPTAIEVAGLRVTVQGRDRLA